MWVSFKTSSKLQEAIWITLAKKPLKLPPPLDSFFQINPCMNSLQNIRITQLKKDKFSVL